MGYGIDELARVLSILRDEGVKYVIIGNTIVQLRLGLRELEGDLDLFVYEPSPILEAGFYHELAAKYGWEASTTEAGTVKLIIPVSNGYLQVDLYENYMDIEIPDEILEKAEPIKLGNIEAPALPLEAYFVLKSRQGVDLDKLAEYLKKLGKSINTRLIEELAGYYPEDEYEVIMNRLRDIGISV